MGIADRVVVATDAREVAAVCAERGIEAVLTRADHPSGTDRVAEVAQRAEFRRFGTVLNVQGDEPTMSAAAARGATELVESGAFAIGTAAAPAHADVLDDPNVVKVVADDTSRALYFSRAPIPYLRDASDSATQKPLIRRHIGVYAYHRDALLQWVALPPHPLELIERLEQLRALAAGIPIGVAHVDEAGAGGIDTEEDLAFANARWHEQPTL